MGVSFAHLYLVSIHNIKMFFFFTSQTQQVRNGNHGFESCELLLMCTLIFSIHDLSLQDLHNLLHDAQMQTCSTLYVCNVNKADSASMQQAAGEEKVKVCNTG